LRWDNPLHSPDVIVGVFFSDRSVSISSLATCSDLCWCCIVASICFFLFICSTGSFRYDYWCCLRLRSRLSTPAIVACRIISVDYRCRFWCCCGCHCLSTDCHCRILLVADGGSAWLSLPLFHGGEFLYWDSCPCNPLLRFSDLAHLSSR
jgi:hypothetical protein